MATETMTKMYAPEGNGGSRRRGFAAMNPEQQREIARKGGKVVSENPTTWLKLAAKVASPPIGEGAARQRLQSPSSSSNLARTSRIQARPACPVYRKRAIRPLKRPCVSFCMSQRVMVLRAAFGIHMR